MTSEEEKKQRFLNSLHNDDLVIRNLPLPIYRIQGDKFNNLREYIPTAFVKFAEAWLPVEIKCSKKIGDQSDFLDLKRNQVLKMLQIGGAFLISGEKAFTVITAKKAVDEGREMESEVFSKPCYRLTKDQYAWSEYPMKLMFY